MGELWRYLSIPPSGLCQHRKGGPRILNSQKSSSSPQQYTQGFTKERKLGQSVTEVTVGGISLRTYMDSHSSLLVRCA